MTIVPRVGILVNSAFEPADDHVYQLLAQLSVPYVVDSSSDLVPELSVARLLALLRLEFRAVLRPEAFHVVQLSGFHRSVDFLCQLVGDLLVLDC